MVSSKAVLKRNMKAGTRDATVSSIASHIKVFLALSYVGRDWEFQRLKSLAGDRGNAWKAAAGGESAI
jgi:hypothetical protein